MILKGNQRGSAKDLALHLMKDENDHVEIHEIRGFASDNLMGAFNEAHAISRGTQCKQFLYSLSLNPPQDVDVPTPNFIATIEEAEKRLNLTGQPRAIVFHEKEGRRHAHAVWSRINIQEMKAIQMSYDHTKLMEYSRELYLEHGWKMPRGLAKQSERDPRNFTLADWQQAKRIKQHPNDIDRAIQDAWAISDTKATFAHALNERGYTLARGDRKGRIVAVDTFGEIYSVPKKVGTRIKQVRERVGNEQHLPLIDQAKEQIAQDMLPTLTRFKKQLKTNQQQENTDLKRERQDMIEHQRLERSTFLATQQQDRQQQAITRQARFRTGLKGLWDRMRGEHKRIRELNEREAKRMQEQAQTRKYQFIQRQLSERQRLNARHKSLQQHYRTQQQELNQDMSHYRQQQLERLREAPKALGKAQSQNVPEPQSPVEQQPSAQVTNQADLDHEARKKAFMEKRNNAQQERTQQHTQPLA